MDKEKMQEMMMDYYRRAFVDRWGETWYSNVIRALIISAEENERQYDTEDKRKNLAVKRLRDESWDPYELIVETQIGLVLVMCQTYIARIVSLVNYFYKDYEALFGKELMKIDTSKRSLMSHFGPRVKGAQYSSVEVIDALANYFKHHEEWGGKLASLRGNEKRTAEIVRSVGADLSRSLWYSQNLTKCTKKLGIGSMREYFSLLKLVDSWKFDIGNRVLPK